MRESFLSLLKLLASHLARGGARTWQALRLLLFSFIKKEAVKLVLKKLTGAFFKTALGNWLVGYLVENFFDEIAFPIIEKGFLYVGYQVEKIEGKILIKRLNKAKKEKDEKEYNDIVIDIWNS